MTADTLPGRFGALAASRWGWITAAVLGAATVLGYAPFGWWPLPYFTVGMLLVLSVDAPTRARASLLGWSFGLGLFLGGVSWVYVSLHDFGAMPAPIAAFFTLLFCAYLAIYPALVAFLTRCLRGTPWLALLVAAPAVWTLGEWVRSWLFTGFPWLALGYTQIPDSPLAALAPVAGLYGVTYCTALTAGLAAWIVATARSSGWRHIVQHPALYVVAVIWGIGVAIRPVQWTEPAGEPVSVSLLQGNIPQDLKWREDRLRVTLDGYREQVLASSSRLIVLPETALPLFLRDVPRSYLAELAEHGVRNRGDILIGVPELSDTGDYYNAVVSVGTAQPQFYRKSHLVPFGEYIPLRPLLGAIVQILAIPLQDFGRGAITQQPLEVAGQRVAVNICYEDVFGEEIIRQLPQATLLVNVSNVAWFGRSIAPAQHLQISQARAMETGRHMLRATNTGMTGIIAPDGRIVSVAPPFERVTVNGLVQGHTGATPYVRWGNYPMLALCTILLTGALLTLRRRSRPQ